MSASKVLKVTVKYGKSKHKGVELDMATMSFEALQGIVFSLTQVAPERQKIILKGKQIESDNDLGIIKNKGVLVVMGSAETSLSKVSQMQFMEDMTDKEKQAANAALPPGLYNLGNTCYLNSTLQCMKGIDELNLGLNNSDDGNSGNGNNGGFVKELSQLFSSMNGTSDAVNPTRFVQDFRTRFPEFATRNEQGGWQQQDAEECLTKLLSTMKTEGFNKIDDLFSGTFETKMECSESSDEAIVEMEERFLKLRCFIDSETRHIAFGIEKSMKEEITKRSNILNRNALWIKSQKISKLPQYLTVSMVRFFWKQSKQKNAKILRSVQFDMKLDVTNFCNDKLKSKISKFRKIKMEAEDAIREKRQKQGIKLEKDSKSKETKNDKDKNEKEKDSKNEAKDDKDVDMTKNDKNGKTDKTDNNDKQDKDSKDKVKAEEKEEKKIDEMEIDDNSDLDESGFYELIGLITHKGLSANSGHYIGYSKDSKRGWLKFDDEIVTEVTEDDIKKLYGGGQWQMGYVCFYKKVKAVMPKQ